MIDSAPADAGYDGRCSGNVMAEVRLGTSSQPVPGRLGAVLSVGPTVGLNVVPSVVPSVLPAAVTSVVPNAVPTAGPTAVATVDVCTGPVGGSLPDDAG